MFAPLVLAMLIPQQPLPLGAIEPYKWGDRPIPVSGEGGNGVDFVDQAIEERMRKHGIVGAGIAIIDGDKIVYAKGFGYSELPGHPFLPTTASRCGSVAKPLTAICALLLAEQGKLKLDEKLVPILKEAGIVPIPCRNEPIDERIHQITVRDLVDHTSGLPGGATYTAWRWNFNVAKELKLNHIATGADVAAHALGNTKLNSDPGTAMEYANANFVLLARVIEARSKMPFNDFLTKVAMPRFGVKPDEIFVSKNQLSPADTARGKTEAAYYQTTDERYVSFVPQDLAKGRTFAEAYRGYATEASDGAGGIAASALGLAKVIANLRKGLSESSIQEIASPPRYRVKDPAFNPRKDSFYRAGFNVRMAGDRMFLSHGGMTMHCGGAIGHNAGYQFVIVSNWNNAEGPYVDSILSGALGEVTKRMRDEE